MPLDINFQRVLGKSLPNIYFNDMSVESFGVVVPSDPRIPHDIFTLRKDNPSIEDGSLVEVEIVSYPSRNNAATGKVVRVIGAGDSAQSRDRLIAVQVETEPATRRLMKWTPRA